MRDLPIIDRDRPTSVRPPVTPAAAKSSGPSGLIMCDNEQTRKPFRRLFRQTMSLLVKELSRFDLPALERHFLALVDDDRRLRFGASLSDAAVSLYVKGIDFGRDAVFGVLDDQLQIIGAAHLARGDDD